MSFARQLRQGSSRIFSQRLKDTSPVALACWHPFEAPIPGTSWEDTAGARTISNHHMSPDWMMKQFFKWFSCPVQSLCFARISWSSLVQLYFDLVPLLPDQSTRSFLLAAPNQVQIMFALLDLVSWEELRPVPSGISCVASSWRHPTRCASDKCQEISGVLGPSVDV